MIREKVVETVNSLKGESGHKKVLEIYNSQDPLPRSYKLQKKDPWCAATVTAVMIMNGYDEISECSCTMMIKKAKDLGIWVEDDAYVPQIGDIIMYDWQDKGNGDDQGTPDHVGIVIKTDKNKIVVREGNKGGTLGNRDVTVNQATIRGYITPPYETEKEALEGELINIPETKEKPEETPQKAESTDLYEIGKVYTINVRSCLNVRKGAGKKYGLVGYDNLTRDGKNHAKGSALMNGTKVTVMEVKHCDDEIWLRIPSGWVCAVDGNKKFIK